MIFWMIVGAVVILALAAAWLVDRRHPGRRTAVPRPEDDQALNEAKATVLRRPWGGYGSGGRGV
jgi:hypothetical protein